MDNQIDEPANTERIGDVDESGHLALALFTTVIAILLIVIYALAQAA